MHILGVELNCRRIYMGMMAAVVYCGFGSDVIALQMPRKCAFLIENRL